MQAARQLRVLLVDRDDEVAQKMARGLQHQTRVAISAQDALDAVQTWDPDAVVLDIELSEKGGYDLAREIRMRFGDRRPLLIGCAASRQTSDRLMARIAGFNHVLSKPCDPGEIAALLAALES